MDATMLNTVVGIIGSFVGVIGIIVGLVGLKSLAVAQSIKNGSIKGNGNTVHQEINNGPSMEDVLKSTNIVFDSKMGPYTTALNSLEDVQHILAQNQKYSIPVIWVGSQKEYDDLAKEQKNNPNVVYFVND